MGAGFGGIAVETALAAFTAGAPRGILLQRHNGVLHQIRGATVLSGPLRPGGSFRFGIQAEPRSRPRPTGTMTTTEAEMTYKGYNPTGMPAETPVNIQAPEIKAPATEGKEYEKRSDA